MPKDIPAYFPFERRAVVRTPQSRPQSGYGMFEYLRCSAITGNCNHKSRENRKGKSDSSAWRVFRKLLMRVPGKKYLFLKKIFTERITFEKYWFAEKLLNLNDFFSGECSSPQDTSLLLPAVYYKQPPPYHILTPEQASPSNSRCLSYQTVPQYSTQMLSPAPSLASFNPASPAYSVSSPSFFPVSYGLLTPPPSDTSVASSSSDSFSLNDSSLGPLAYIPETAFFPSCNPLPCEEVLPKEVCTVSESKIEPTRIEEIPAQVCFSEIN